MRFLPILLAACHIGNPALERRVAALEAENVRLRAELEAPRHLPVDQAAMGISRLQAEAFIDARIQLAVGAQLAQLATDVSNHVASTADLRELVVADAGARTVTINSANLQIINGAEFTDDGANGLGNLIIGYGEGNDLTGSHNLVVGTNHNVSGYAGTALGDGGSVGDFSLSVQSQAVDLASDQLTIGGPSVSISGASVTVDGSTDLSLYSPDVVVDGEDVLVSSTNTILDSTAQVSIAASAGLDLESAALLSLEGSLITLN